MAPVAPLGSPKDPHHAAPDNRIASCVTDLDTGRADRDFEGSEVDRRTGRVCDVFLVRGLPLPASLIRPSGITPGRSDQGTLSVVDLEWEAPLIGPTAESSSTLPCPDPVLEVHVSRAVSGQLKL